MFFIFPHFLLGTSFIPQPLLLGFPSGSTLTPWCSHVDLGCSFEAKPLRVVLVLSSLLSCVQVTPTGVFP